MMYSRAKTSSKMYISINRHLKRNFNLQEYQSKRIMSDRNIFVQKFSVCDSQSSAIDIANKMKVPEYVIKAQILAGGRGKGIFSNGFKGGVHLTKDPLKIPYIVSNMIGNNLITPQTPASGIKVNKVMIAEAMDIARETYLAILLDRQTSSPIIIACREGGVSIEELAERSPHLIHREVVNIDTGLTDEQAQLVASKLGFESPDKKRSAADQIKSLYKMFNELDCTQVEVNPFGETVDGRVMSFDAKLSFDPAAVSLRQDKIKALFNETALELDNNLPADHPDRLELRASELGLNYVGMPIDDTDLHGPGNRIGCIVNGAGLAMATMDLINSHGGKCANFLDLGGSVNQKQVEAAFQLLKADSRVSSIFVNIFGGIVNCVTVAEGILAACSSQDLSIPLVVRLEGNSVQPARKLIETFSSNASFGSNLIHAETDLDSAAQLAVDMAQSSNVAKRSFS